MEGLFHNNLFIFDFLFTYIENYFLIKMINLFFEEKKNISFLYALALTIMSYILNCIMDVYMTTYLLLIMVICYSIINLQGILKKKILVIFFTFVGLFALDLCVALIARFAGMSMLDYYLTFNSDYFFIMSLQKFLLFIIYIFIREYLRKDLIISNKTTTFVSLLLICSVITPVIVLSKYSSQTIIDHLSFWVIIICFVCMMILIFCIYLSIVKDYRIILEQNILLETQRQEARLYALLEEKISEMNKLNHDFHNHKIVIENMIKENDKSLDCYLDDLRQDYFIYTNNEVVNYLLNEKIALAKSLNIDVKCMIQGSLKKSISHVDLCIVLGNLLDNAIEASQRTNHGYINIDIIEDEYKLILKVENSYQEVNYSKNRYTSTKRGTNHGFGLSNIKLICDKYNGTDYMEHKNGIFKHTCILLYG